MAQFPDIVPPQIIVTGTYTGADAVTIEQSVATPLEQQMNGVDNMLYMQSTNGNDGTMQLTVTFDIDTDPNIDQVNVQNRMAQAQPNLPTDVTQFGLTMRKSTGLPMMLVVALLAEEDRTTRCSSPTTPTSTSTTRSTACRASARSASSAPATTRCASGCKPDRLATMGLTVPEIARAVQQQSTVNPAGQIGGAARRRRAGDDLHGPRAPGGCRRPRSSARSSCARTRTARWCACSDVARIELGALNYQQIGRVNGQPGVGIARLPGARLERAGSRRMASADDDDAAEAALSRPTSTTRYTLDTTLPVTEGIKEILKTLVEAMVLVILVVFLFLQNWRATLIPMLAVPVSLIGTFAVFPLLGFSINTLSLFGLVLAIGLVVDDAIVVVEAVEHHIEQGMSPRDATLKAMKEVSGPVVGIALDPRRGLHPGRRS